MVYVEKFKVKGKVYYRLVHAIRKGKKITHKIRYLGKKLPSAAKLKQLKQKFANELTSGKFKYFSSEDVKKIEIKKMRYADAIKKLSPIERKKQLEEFIIRFTYDSSKLSGVAVTLRQTSLILKEGIMPKNMKSLLTVKELENHEKGILTLTKYKGKLDTRFLKKIHKILFTGVDDSIAGKLRDELRRNVKIAGTSYVPPKWHDLQKELHGFFLWYKNVNRRLHPLELASLIHLRFISLQPFGDGNSRLARLLMNWILWKKNYPPINIPIEDLENYYNVLDKYQVEKNEKPFIDYIKKQYLRN